MDSNKILVVIGYLLALFFSFVGFVYGLILYLLADDEYVKRHAKYIMIVGFILSILGFIIVFVMMGAATFTALIAGSA